MSHIHSSALSDDGKFSTRALRGYGPSDLEYPAAEPIRLRPDGDGGTGLSTHVEYSDKGSRKQTHHHHDERIVEVEEEGSGRSTPPGTIGEQHEYMSENIESHVVHKIKNNLKAGNKSVIGAKDMTSNIARNGQQNEQQESSSVAALSHFAVVRDKIPLQNDAKHQQEFRLTYERLFKEFNDKLMEEYRIMKEGYINDY